MTDFNFFKMNGLGNDFVIIDQRSNPFELNENQIKTVCDRKQGIGCDQLIYIRNSDQNEFYLMKFFNSSGEEISACGNGTRCVANYLMNEMNSNEIKINTIEKIVSCKKQEDNSISVEMGTPKFHWDEIPLLHDIKQDVPIFTFGEKMITDPFFVNIGNPHAIFFVNEINDYNIDEFGPVIECNKLFPEKINVSFAKIINDNKILLNVWERGAGKTEACGTAACATVVAAVESGLSKNKVLVRLPGGNLDIHYNENKNIIMTGHTQWDFEGKFKI
tara:strand:- start:1146 stop:1970 length:825 start_codon:yes stop_codon:yes gene_type:complete